jgi:uncharacterized membrane protein
MPWIDWFWRFIACSFLGWLMESAIFTIQKHRWVNRGFLNGPLCPIYGCGAILILLVLGPFKDFWPLLLLAGILITTILEYATSWLMEVLFHARWWDYSKMPFNLHGRITLFHSLIWGALCLGLVYGLDPFLTRLLEQIPLQWRIAAGAATLVLLLADLAVTVLGMIDLNRQLARLQDTMKTIRRKNSELGKNVRQRLAFLAISFRELRHQAARTSAVQRRLLLAFPNLRSLHYQDALYRLRRWMKKTSKSQIWPMADIMLLRDQLSSLRSRPSRKDKK